jgi:hypothetical protein
MPLSLQSQRRAAAVEKQHGARVLQQTAQDRKQAARLLDISFPLAAFKRSNKLKFSRCAFLAASAEPASAGSSIP